MDLFRLYRKKMNLAGSLFLEKENCPKRRMELSKEQVLAYEKWRQGENVFVTGPGGCGKTHFIQYIYATQIRHLVVSAMTGCAAVLLDCNATTIHSWSGIGLGNDSAEKLLEKIMKKAHLKKRWSKVECLVIDEVSMLSKRMFETLDYLARNLRKCQNKPFGGIQIVFSGDFFQLPPVNETEFCFESPLWDELFPRNCQVQFHTIFRQKENDFQNVLNQIRTGSIDKKSILKLKQCLNRVPPKHIQVTKLYPIRNKVDKMNEIMFHSVPQPETLFQVMIRTDIDTYLENRQKIPSSILLRWKKLTPKQQEQQIIALQGLHNFCSLCLKVGTFVMCTKNLDLEDGICNGSQGILSEFIEGRPMVRFVNGIEMQIPIHYVQSEDYPNIVIGQYPLIYAWATTIHKIQGSSLDCAEIDIGTNIFTSGQSYTALSRVKSFEGLFLKSFSEKNIYAHPRVLDFYRRFNN